MIVLDVDEEVFEEKCKIVKLLANPIRLKMAYIMSKREVCNCELEKLFKVDPTLISHHLKRFKEAGVLKERREGKWRKYRIDDEKVKKIIEVLFEENTSGRFKL